MHGDDFVFVGKDVHLKNIAGHMAQSFSIKVAVSGPRSMQTLRVLNRSITWSQEGIVYESDHRHADRLIEELNLDKKQVVATPVIRESRKAVKKEAESEGAVSPGTSKDSGASAGRTGANAEFGDGSRQERAHPKTSAGRTGASRGGVGSSDGSPRPPNGAEGDRGAPLGEEATRYRAMVARCNFLGCDRPDIQYAAKEASRWMSSPCRGDMERIARIGKYLNGGFRRVVQIFFVW